jgi:hypothetical protein
MERLWYLMTMDSTLVCKLMAEFETTGKVNVPTFLANKVMNKTFDFQLFRPRLTHFISSCLALADISKFYPSPLAQDKILISTNPC